MTRSLDLRATLRLIDELSAELERLDGIAANREGGKRLSSQMAEVNRKLLYTAHLADAIRVNILSHYHEFKGEQDPPFLT